MKSLALATLFSIGTAPMQDIGTLFIVTSPKGKSILEITDDGYVYFHGKKVGNDPDLRRILTEAVKCGVK